MERRPISSLAHWMQLVNLSSPCSIMVESQQWLYDHAIITN